MKNPSLGGFPVYTRKHYTPYSAEDSKDPSFCAFWVIKVSFRDPKVPEALTLNRAVRLSHAAEEGTLCITATSRLASGVEGLGVCLGFRFRVQGLGFGRVWGLRLGVYGHSRCDTTAIRVLGRRFLAKRLGSEKKRTSRGVEALVNF